MRNFYQNRILLNLVSLFWTGKLMNIHSMIAHALGTLLPLLWVFHLLCIPSQQPISTFKAPDKVGVMITTSGIIVSDLFYDYKSIRDFSIVHEPPDVSILYLDFHSSLHPLMSVPLEEMDPNLVRDALIPFVLENFHRDEETLTDLMRRLYKLG